MSWRTVIIEGRCKLDYRMGYMVVRSAEIRRVFLVEIAVLVIENPAVSLTGCLLEALVAHKVHVIFCDQRRSPLAELEPLHGCHDSAARIKAQIAWTDARRRRRITCKTRSCSARRSCGSTRWPSASPATSCFPASPPRR